MLPGVLDALLKHGNDDLTCADALLKMLPPLEAAMDSYRARATAAKEYPSRESSLARVVLIEAAVQGWPGCAPHWWHPTKFLDDMIDYLDPHMPLFVVPPPGSPDSVMCKIGEKQSWLRPGPLRRGLGRQRNMGLASPAPDIVPGSSNKEPSRQGESMSAVQDVEDPAEPQRGLSEAEKTERRKVKKARQRAARAQNSAQAMEAQGVGSTKSGSAEGLGGGSGQKESAQAKPDKQPPETVQVSEAVHVMHESLPAARPSEHLSKAAASSRSSSLSPQPSKHLHDGRSPGQQALAPSSWAAPAAQQVQPLAAEEEEPWQEVSRARRKAVRQQTTTKNGVPGGPMQGRVVPDQAAAPQSPPRLRRLQAGAQHEAQALANPRTAVLPFPAQPAGDVTEQLPFLLQTLAGTHLGMQHEPVQATASLTPQDEEDCSAPQQMLYPWVHSQSSSSEQAAKTGDEENLDNEELCIVCWERLRDVIFRHCMHMCTCQSCAKDIMAAGAPCPLCRTNIERTITVRL